MPRCSAVLLFLALAGCKTIRITEAQFFDARAVAIPDSIRRDAAWPRPLVVDDGQFEAAGAGRLYRLAFIHPHAKQAILYFGGSNFQIGQDYRRFTPLVSLGATVMVFDYPGYGASEGEASIDSFERAALAAYDELLRISGIPPSGIVLHGHSLGSMLAMYVSSHRTVGGVVLEGPATNAHEWAQTFTPWFARPFVRYDIPVSLAKHDNLSRARELRAPLLILVGSKDRDTKPIMARRLYEAAGTRADQKRIVVLDGTDHLVLRRDSRAVSEYRRFLELLRP